MVGLKRATTSCLVQKEKTQTRITFNNLSANLTVSDLYKYVQLHLEEDRPFELSLVCGGGGGDSPGVGAADLDLKSSEKVSLKDQKQKTLLAAGLSFENGAANTVVLISSPAEQQRNEQQQHQNGHEEYRRQPEEPRIVAKEMVVPCGEVEESTVVPTTTNGATNGASLPRAAVPTNGHANPPAGEEDQELNDFSRQITINTKLQGNDDEDPAPLISPIDFSPPVEANAAAFEVHTIPEPPPFPALEYPSTSTGAAAAAAGNRTIRLQTSPSPSSSSSGKYVGLVNQAMTCYLNSLLQALYMTPEFRNGVYNWEFDGQDESKSIPYQLQRLFLNLQTSPKSAVETTDLTRSFGWDSSEAWQQHDIQELCRVMFDALEHKFKNTKESNLINRLYEGKMIDYLKCLSCGTEKQREDTFLDIPLPVKPFGSSVAFESVEEALRAFIQPEILNGNNQYNCETCQKKCDAHKGLKFSKFPYILTLHLKRFDFDYQTFHRIKLNDKVTFPQTLNLNGFVNTATEFPGGADEPPHTNGDGSGHNNGHASSVAMDIDEEDGGVDVSSEEESATTGGATNHNGNGSSSTTTFGSHSGPYLYELFAIMIHSGSASGGHYYVYIKDLDSGNWNCFNDQSVTPITQEDIQKSFGGNAGRYQYSGAYTTSTNAYMMMYRQIDPARNKLPTKVDELPEHIKTLQQRLKDRQEVDIRRRNNTDCSVITTRVYHYDRERCKLSDVKIHISSDSLMDELLQRAYDRMSLATLRSLNLCRLVAFDSRTERTLASIEHHDQTMLQDVLDKYSRCDFLLEERDREEKFRAYTSPMLNARVYFVDLRSGDVNGPMRVPILHSATVAELKQEVGRVLKTRCVGEIRVALAKGNRAVILDNDQDVLQLEIDANELCPVKLFVAESPTDAVRLEQFDVRLRRIVERFDRIVSLYFKVPQITPATRKLNSIPEFVAPASAADVTESPPMVVVKVEEVEQAEPMQLSSPDATKALSPTPEPSSHSECMSSSSPEPHAAATDYGKPDAEEKVDKEGATSTDVKTPIKKKSLSVKTVKKEGDESKSKDKSPVRIVETTKEVTENGVTKKVRVIKRIVKRDPAKKAAAAAIAPENSDNAAAPSTAPTPTKVVKKVKVAKEPVEVQPPVASPPTETKPEVSLEAQPLAAPPVVSVEQLPKPVTAVVETESKSALVDPFTFLDQEPTFPDGQYFRAIQKPKTLAEQNGSLADDEMRLIQVHVEKNMTISVLKNYLEPILEVSKDYFKINRSRSETLRLNELVSNMSDGEEFMIELGRILLDGEYKYRVYHMALSAVTDYTEELEYVCDYIVRNNQRVDEVKKGILEYLQQTGKKAVADKAPQSYRLWTKLYQSLSQACMDDVVLGEEVSLRRNGEMVLEEIEEDSADPMSDCDDFVVFVRKWNPDTLVLEPYQSLTLPLKSDLIERIAEKSGLPAERLEYARNMVPFPKMKISRASINSDMDWKAEPFRTTFENSRNGHVYFYRDKSVPAKELTPQEVADIQREETAKRDEAKATLNGACADQNGSGDSATTALGDLGSSSFTATAKNNNHRRKEKALKIYVDSSPAKVAT